MKFFKFILIAGLGLLILLTCNNINVIAQNTSKVDELKKQINEKIEEARGYLKNANNDQNTGDYDNAYDNAEKVKGISLEISQLKEQLDQEITREKELKANAENKIKEAKTLISKAEKLEGDKWAPEELASAKSSLLSAENVYEQQNYDESIKLATESIEYANSCLSKIEEIKKQQELEAMRQKELPEQNLVRKGRYMIRTNYTVRLIPERRDCLWRIAEYKYIYGNPWKWPIIYKANQEQIKNPDLIFPGQIFDIPGLDEQGNPLLAEPEKKVEKAPSAEKKEIYKGQNRKSTSQDVPNVSE